MDSLRSWRSWWRSSNRSARRSHERPFGFGISAPRFAPGRRPDRPRLARLPAVSPSARFGAVRPLVGGVPQAAGRACLDRTGTGATLAGAGCGLSFHNPGAKRVESPDPDPLVRGTRRNREGDGSALSESRRARRAVGPGTLARQPRGDLGSGLPPAPPYAVGDPAFRGSGGGLDPWRVCGPLPAAGAAAGSRSPRLGGRADSPGHWNVEAARGGAAAGLRAAVACRGNDDSLS